MQISNNQLYFLGGSILFVGVSLIFNLFLLVGACCGAFGMFFVMRWYIPYKKLRDIRLLARKKAEVERLEHVVYG